jgi:hypothetical protein
MGDAEFEAERESAAALSFDSFLSFVPQEIKPENKMSRKYFKIFLIIN